MKACAIKLFSEKFFKKPQEIVSFGFTNTRCSIFPLTFSRRLLYYSYRLIDRDISKEDIHMNIKLFSKNNCMQCKMAKRFLSDNNISFEEINIDNDPSAVDWLREKGFQSVPIVTSDATTVVGFRPDQLRQLAS